MGTTTAGDGEELQLHEDAALVRSFLLAFVGGDGDAMGDLVTADCTLHQPRWPLDTTGREAIVEKTRQSGGAFTDLEMEVVQTVREGDRIAAMVRASGRNVGPIRMEDREVAPTGRRFDVPQFGIYRVEDDLIAEAWVLADALGLVEQLGNLPSGPAAMLRIATRQLRWRVGGKSTLE